MTIRWVAAICAVSIIACARKDNGQDTPPTNETPAASDSVSQPATPPAPALGPQGIGPVDAGMTLAEAGQALNASLETPASAECGYVHTSALPEGAAIMVVNDTIVRIDVQTNAIATDRGARIGDTEEHIRSLYGDGLVTQPHKYTDGHYLIVTPADTMLRLVFETDADTVTHIRSGRMPQVLWVEGCS
jgi:hypothetical protein